MNKKQMWLACAAIGFACATGCQQYVAKPPNLAGHHAAWLERSPGDERVANYAAQLREAGAAQEPFDVNDGVTLSEAELIALVFNGELRVSRAQAGVAAATEENAGLWDDPTVGVDVMHMLANVQHPWITAASVGFTIPISGRLGRERLLAEAEHATALQRVAEMEWETVTELRETWLKWSAAEEELTITRTFLEELGSLVNIVEEMLAAGEMSRLESRLFQVEELTSQQELASLEGMRDALTIELRRLMGLSPSAEVDLVPTVSIGPEHVPSLGNEAMVLARNAQLRTLFAEYEAAERALELEIRKQYPDIVIGPRHEYEEDRHRVGLGVSMPFPIFNANRLGIARARAERERAMAELETALEAVLTDLAAADVAHATAAKQREIVESQIVPLVDAQFDDAREVARLGEVDTLLLLETLRRQYATKRELVSLIREESEAVVRREQIIGPPPMSAPPEPDANGVSPADANDDQEVQS